MKGVGAFDPDRFHLQVGFPSRPRARRPGRTMTIMSTLTPHRTHHHDRNQMSLLGDPIQEEFLTFHHRHPEVYRTLVHMARQWKASGHETCSMKMLFEILRWESGIARTDGYDFALNNNYTSRFARLIAANEPDLAHMFRTRQLAA